VCVRVCVCEFACTRVRARVKRGESRLLYRGVAGPFVTVLDPHLIVHLRQTYRQGRSERPVLVSEGI
jgi:ribosomal protein S28E/S33